MGCFPVFIQVRKLFGHFINLCYKEKLTTEMGLNFEAFILLQNARIFLLNKEYSSVYIARMHALRSGRKNNLATSMEWIIVTSL